MHPAYSFVLRSEGGSGYKIDCRFGRSAAIEFASQFLDPPDHAADAVAQTFDEHETEGHGMFSVGSVGTLTLVAVKE